MKITGSKIMVEQFRMNEVTPGGIALPSKSVQSLPFGKIIGLGPTVPKILKIGDVVLFPEIGPTLVFLKEQPFLLIEAEDVLGILEEGEY
jgi:co-chaperonin GroES (HSP10)